MLTPNWSLKSSSRSFFLARSPAIFSSMASISVASATMARSVVSLLWPRESSPLLPAVSFFALDFPIFLGRPIASLAFMELGRSRGSRRSLAPAR